MLQKPPSNKKAGKINIFLIGLFVLWPWNHTQAQANSDIHVHGHVTDRVTGQPISGAYMELKDNAQNTLAHTNTNADGDFDLSASRDAASIICATATTVDNRGYSVQDHIRLCKNIAPPLENDLQLDMALQPAGNLIIQAYDEHGNIIRFSAFTAVNGYYVFITDLTDLPISGVLSNVQDATSRQNGGILEKTIPAFLAPLQTPSILHILWDVPTFGRVILDLDNGGGGYSISKKGDFLVINFNQEAARSEVARFERELSLFTSKGYTFSSTVTSNLTPAKSALDSGNLHLLKNPPDTASAVSNFNEALVNALRGQELLYLEKAQADIPRYRQGTLRLSIKNPDGSPLAHTSITFHQTSHDFLFGGSYLTDGWNYLPQEGNLLKEAGFNQSSVAMLYQAIEPTPGTYDFSYPDKESGLDILFAKGFIMDGELAYWAHSNDFNCPAYWKSMNFNELKQNIYNHFKALASHFGPRIHLWNINEQNLPWANCTGLSWEQKLEVYQSVMDGLHACYPAARNNVESIAMPFSWEQEILEDTTSIPAQGIAFPVYLDLVQQHGLPIDTIGLEFYHFGVTAPPDSFYAPPGLSLASIARYMNLYN